MLGLQARNIEEQERLYKNQIRLNMRTILRQELDFYHDAFQSVSNNASILGGFAFSGLLLDPFGKMDIDEGVDSDSVWRFCEGMFYFFCFSATVVSLLTLVFTNFSALFSMRLALRGGPTSVEDAIAKVRGEYNVALWALVAAVELFIMSIPFIGFYKLKWYNGAVGAIVCSPSAFIVLLLYRRANKKFDLAKSGRFGSTSTKKQHHHVDTDENGEVRNHIDAAHNEPWFQRTGLIQMMQVIDSRNQERERPKTRSDKANGWRGGSNDRAEARESEEKVVDEDEVNEELLEIIDKEYQQRPPERKKPAFVPMDKDSVWNTKGSIMDNIQNSSNAFGGRGRGVGRGGGGGGISSGPNTLPPITIAHKIPTDHMYTNPQKLKNNDEKVPLSKLQSRLFSSSSLPMIEPLSKHAAVEKKGLDTPVRPVVSNRGSGVATPEADPVSVVYGPVNRPTSQSHHSILHNWRHNFHHDKHVTLMQPDSIGPPASTETLRRSKSSTAHLPSQGSSIGGMIPNDEYFNSREDKQVVKQPGEHRSSAIANLWKSSKSTSPVAKEAVAKEANREKGVGGGGGGGGGGGSGPRKRGVNMSQFRSAVAEGVVVPPAVLARSRSKSFSEYGSGPIKPSPPPPPLASGSAVNGTGSLQLSKSKSKDNSFIFHGCFQP